MQALSQTPASATAGTTPPAPGQYWPGQGGVYVGICRGEDGQPPRHIVVATAPEASFTGAWGEYGKDVPGAKHRFEGRTNTVAMAAAGSEIAQRVLALQIDGHQDFHIGSQAEMALASANAPELFEPGYHWSSTQVSRNGAFVQGFEFGSSFWDGKDGEHRVRAFRGLPLESLNTLAEGPDAIFSEGAV
ncbi:hypothetical protein [Polaromonas jejuensis]|uniref:DUF1566 domain-containing protein n=1 Tax=Polaromonas jejuensis TaxID=457502 RepID=A0ABW0QGX5_9BURK|nr:hypothetical protein [Polaromonas jejuensis]